MNAIRRIVQWFATVLAHLRGMNPETVRPLPPPVVDPDVTLPALLAEAEARAVVDAESMMYDHWSFGVEDDEPSDERDPDYVRSLRRRCAAAIAQLQARDELTDARLAQVNSRVAETAQFMADARVRMGAVAAWETDRERRDLLNVLAGDEVAGVPAASAGNAVWEGESTALQWYWRLLILGCLVAVEYPVQRYVYDFYLTGSAAAELAAPLTLATSGLVILAPYLAGLLYRGRRATGGERRLAAVVAVMALPWLYAIGLLGFLRGRVLEVQSGSGGTARSDQLHVIPITVVVMFVALLLLAGLMAFLLGLARRHPYQEAYARQRRRHEEYQTMARRMAEGINPSYHGAGDTAGAGDRFLAAERVLRETYLAVEEAYFAALERAVGDPTFTEAVSRRRGLRPVPPAVVS